jgi:hypothetical protein
MRESSLPYEPLIEKAYENDIFIGYGNFLGMNVLPNCRLIKNQDFKL